LLGCWTDVISSSYAFSQRGVFCATRSDALIQMAPESVACNENWISHIPLPTLRDWYHVTHSNVLVVCFYAHLVLVSTTNLCFALNLKDNNICRLLLEDNMLKLWGCRSSMNSVRILSIAEGNSGGTAAATTVKCGEGYRTLNSHCSGSLYMQHDAAL
jgi:hypothetical protein